MKAVMLGYWVIFLGVVLQVFGLLWDLELPPIGWQLFILGSSQSYSTAFPTFLDTCATRLLAEPLSRLTGANASIQFCGTDICSFACELTKNEVPRRTLLGSSLNKPACLRPGTV